MMIGHTEPSAYEIQMASHREAMKHAKLLSLAMFQHASERDIGITPPMVARMIRSFTAAFLASMPNPPMREAKAADIEIDIPEHPSNGWKRDPLAAPDLIKGDRP